MRDEEVVGGAGHDHALNRVHSPSHSHTHGHSHSHDHAAPVDAPLRALFSALAITATLFVAEVVGGLISGSMALLADAMHMLSDAAGLIIAVTAIVIGRRAMTRKATFGFKRVEVLAALINAVLVILISVWLVVQAVGRLGLDEEINTSVMMIVALGGLVANLLAAWILQRHRETSVNLEGAFLHVLVDLLGSVAVLVAGAIIKFTGFTAADTIASLIIAGMVLPRAWQLMSRSARVLLEQVPSSFDTSKVAPALQYVEGVMDFHDLHLWSLDGSSVIATVHLVVDDAAESGRILDQAQARLLEMGIAHATIQIERPEHVSHEEVC